MSVTKQGASDCEGGPARERREKAALNLTKLSYRNTGTPDFNINFVETSEGKLKKEDKNYATHRKCTRISHAISHILLVTYFNFESLPRLDGRNIFISIASIKDNR